jgi:hypothetical protein
MSKTKIFIPCDKCKFIGSKPVGKPRYSRCGDEVVVAQQYRITYNCKKCGKNVLEEMEVAD